MTLLSGNLGAGHRVGKTSGTQGWYPIFCAWLQEVRPGTSLEENQTAAVSVLKPMIIRRLASAETAFYDSDVDICCDLVFERIEEKLQRKEFPVDVAPVADPSESRPQIVPPGVHKVTFSFELAQPELIRQGYRIRLLGEGAVWEEDGHVEQFDSQKGTLRVVLSANRLRHGQKYCLELCTPGSGVGFARQKFHVVHVEAIHLLRLDAFTVVARHPDLRATRRYHARFSDMHDGSQLLAISSLTGESDECLPIHLQYHVLRHEQNARVEISHEGSPGLAYFCCVRAVQHETWKSRSGYTQQVARVVASERVRAMCQHPHTSLDDEFGKDVVAKPDDERQRMAGIVYRRAIDQARSLIKRLPNSLQTQLVEHYIEDRSWAEIATRHNITEAKAKQDSSRALRELSKAIATQPEADHSGIVKWLKEMLSEILRR
jgi:DNA-directed RNA polymerase specialized sigma24 family protein